MRFFRFIRYLVDGHPFDAMTLRKKTLLIIIATQLFLIVGVIGSSNFIFKRSFDRIEHDNAIVSAERVDNAIDQEFDFLTRKLGDYAAWDSSYDFIKDHNKKYIDNDIGASLLVMSVNIIVFLDTNDHIVWGQYADTINKKLLPLPKYFNDRLFADNPLVKFDHKTDTKEGKIVRHAGDEQHGLMALPDGVMLLAGRPIIHTDNSGPIRGSIVFGKWLNQATITTMAQVLRLNLSISSAVNQAVLLENYPMMREEASNRMKTIILKNDIYDKPATFIAITAPRPIYQQRIEVMFWFVVILIALATILTLAVLWIVDRMVLKRVLRLNWTVHKIQHTGDLQTRVVLPGKDELSDLTSSINSMLESLFKAKQRDEVANTKLLQASRVASVGSLISSFAHELNNPLMVMQGNLMLLNQSLSPVLPENSEARVFMKNQNDALCRIVTTIKRLRTVIQPVTNIVTPLNVHDAIEQSIQIIERSYKLEGIDVIRAFYAPVTTILCNANKFQQMLLCLLSNSYKALANRDNKRITIYTELEDHQLVLKVIDNGCGIETEKLSSLLDSHTLVEHVAAGDCMGLSIAYDTVQELSGAISCSSQLHEGTIFTVRIPLPIAKAA